jgi:hypothetical protein
LTMPRISTIKLEGVASVIGYLLTKIPDRTGPNSVVI